jgi:hypothetical protein
MAIKEKVGDIAGNSLGHNTPALFYEMSPCEKKERDDELDRFPRRR